MLLAYILGSVIAITVLLIVGIHGGSEWCRSVFRAWDYLGAAICGGDGKHSISAYLGRGTTIWHRVGRFIVDAMFGQGHCEEAAKKEFR